MIRVHAMVSRLGFSIAFGAAILVGAGAIGRSQNLHDRTGGAADLGVTPGPGQPTLGEVRRATERFRDVKVALAEGYIRDPGNLCDTADMMGRPASLGAMGVHYFRPDLLGITAPPSPRVNGVGAFACVTQKTTSRSPLGTLSRYMRPRTLTACSEGRWSGPQRHAATPDGAASKPRSVTKIRKQVRPLRAYRGDRRIVLLLGSACSSAFLSDD
jgi:hypothetical protein